MDLLLASGNPKKAGELKSLLEPLGIQVLSPADVGGLPEVDEDQDTFEGNAKKKAVSGALTSGKFTLADDSGLMVDALEGLPGVHSARYAGQHGDDAANNRKLIEALQGSPPEARAAHFVCCLALSDPAGQILCVTRGEVHGRILNEARGQGGFGYDPLFQVHEPDNAFLGRCMAELTAAEKGTISHRGRALRDLAKLIPSHLGIAP
ncbi:MAG: XTP/dITP diphosphohydrolase [Glaciecola sp.]|jgi:XTP/dITP diphosphohydrolase